MLRRAKLAVKLTVRLLLTVGLLGLLHTTALWISSPSDTPIIKNISPCKFDWLRLRFSHETNTFELSLAVEIANNSHGSGSNINSANRWVIGRHFRRRHYQQRIYTFADLAELPDRHWKRPIPPSVYLLYPQALDMTQVVADIANCRPIPEAPMFTQTVRFLNISSTVCAPSRAVERALDAVVMVKSSVYNFADRQLLRKTYAEESAFRMALIFSVGLPRSSGGRFFHRDGFNISLPERAGESMEKMESQRPEVLRNLTGEVQLHGDIVLGDYEDTYYNLSLKLFHTFQWAAGFCREHFAHQQPRPPVFILMDDDCAFNASHLKAQLDGLSDAEIRRVTWGIPFYEARVIRSPFDKKYGKWALSKQEVPWPFHAPYAPSTFLVFGADVLQEITLAMHFTRQFPVDDAWLGLIMTKLDLHFERRAHMYQFPPKHVPKELVLAAPYKYLFGS